MSMVSKEQIAQAKQLDLYSYLYLYNRDELVKSGLNEYCTKTHDSLKISNGKWIWNSRRIGGRSALDYLVKVEGMEFVEAVEHLCQLMPCTIMPPSSSQGQDEEQAAKEFALPEKHDGHNKTMAYLKWRGLDPDIIQDCINRGLIYEQHYTGEKGEYDFYNCVFVGLDDTGQPAYAMQRGLFSNYCGEVSGSNKAFSFIYSPSPMVEVERVATCESAIDALSFSTLEKQENPELWKRTCYLSLGCNADVALFQFLRSHPWVRQVALALDNDEGGILSAENIAVKLRKQEYLVTNNAPPLGKDPNEYLLLKNNLGHRIRVRPKRQKKKYKTR